jgi:hypothetical protein
MEERRVEIVRPDHMLSLGMQFAGLQIGENQSTNTARFRSTYGIDPTSCSEIYYDLETVDIGNKKVENLQIIYFFLTLFWLRSYSTETALAATFKLHERTIRNYLWRYAEAIQALKSIKVRNCANNDFALSQEIS